MRQIIFTFTFDFIASRLDLFFLDFIFNLPIIPLIRVLLLCKAKLFPMLVLIATAVTLLLSKP